MRKIITILLLFLSIVAHSATYYVATWGSDGNAGTLASPWYSWQKGFMSVTAGDTVYFRGGTWYPTGRAFANYAGICVINEPSSVPAESRVIGTRANPICYFNYPGEIPILDCSLIDENPASNIMVAINIGYTQYLKFKGLTIRNVTQLASGHQAWGIAAGYSANLTFENMTIHDVEGRGYWIQSGAWNSWDAAGALWDSDSTYFTNCDTYNLFDSLSAVSPGNAADAWKVHTYQNNYYKWTGCRAWNYSDDGIDPSGQGYRIFDNCWTMASNKYYYEGESWTPERNGFKATGIQKAYYIADSLLDVNDTIFVKYTNCLALFCEGSGFYNNILYNVSTAWPNNAFVYNNTSYKNGTGFTDLGGNNVGTSVYRNNISYLSTLDNAVGWDADVAIYYLVYTESNNTWDENWGGSGYPNFVTTDTVTVTAADFTSLDSATLVTLFIAPRQADGSLPTTRPLQLAEGSDLIDAGIDVGLSYVSTAPDIGYVEYGIADSTATDILSFTFSNIVGLAVIDASAHTVTATLLNGEDVSTITPTFTLSPGATSDPASGAEDDYTSPVTITVTAADAVTSQEWTVTITEDTAPTVPTVTTTAGTYVNAAQGTTSGNVVSDGGDTVTERGIVWGLSISPTLSNNYVVSGSGTGTFTATFRQLEPGTTYYARAYATNGGGTAYGDQISFTTPATNNIVNGTKLIVNGTKIIVIE